MDIGKLKGLTIGDLTARAQALAEKLAPTDPDFANDLALSLVKGVISGNDDLSSIVSLFGEDADISGGLFPEEPVTVTKTTTSVGGLPPADIGDTPEEKAMLDNSGDSDKLFDLFTNPDTSDADIDKALAEMYPGDNTPPADLGDTPEEKELLDQVKEGSKEEKPAEEKPAEEKPAEEKPAEKPSEKKSEQSDTDKNIIGALSNLK